MAEDLKTFSREYYLAAGECNGEQELPIWLLANRIIEVATLHANSWGAGYKRLIQSNQAWVLSRLTIEMEEYPKVGENYTLTTWIESFNRHFSERNVEIQNDKGKAIGYARSVWAVIDITTRQSCDISALDFMKDNIIDRECPIDKQSRVKDVAHTRECKHIFKYSDIDFNRHVNTIKYICAILDQWDLEYYDKNLIHRFEISFIKETYCGTEVIIGIDDTAADGFTAEITHEGNPLCKSKIIFTPRR